MIRADSSVILDVQVDPLENCFPMVPSGAAHNEMLFGDETADAERSLVTDDGLALV